MCSLVLPCCDYQQQHQKSHSVAIWFTGSSQPTLTRSACSEPLARWPVTPPPQSMATAEWEPEEHLDHKWNDSFASRLRDWRARFPCRGHPLLQWTGRDRPGKVDQRPWAVYTSTQHEWVLVPTLILCPGGVKTEPLAGAPAEADMFTTLRNGRWHQHWTTIQRMKFLAESHPLVDEVLRLNPGNKAADKAVFNPKTGRVTHLHQSPWNFCVVLAASGARFDVGLSANGIAAKDGPQQPGGLLSLWWRPPQGPRHERSPRHERDMAEAVFHDITELSNFLPQDSDLARAYKRLPTPKARASGGQPAGSSGSSGSQAVAKQMPQPQPRSPEAPPTAAGNGRGHLAGGHPHEDESDSLPPPWEDAVLCLEEDMAFLEGCLHVLQGAGNTPEGPEPQPESRPQPQPVPRSPQPPPTPLPAPQAQPLPKPPEPAPPEPQPQPKPAPPEPQPQPKPSEEAQPLARQDPQPQAQPPAAASASGTATAEAARASTQAAARASRARAAATANAEATRAGAQAAARASRPRAAATAARARAAARGG